MKEEEKGKIKWWLVVCLTLFYFLFLIMFTVPIGMMVFEYKYFLYHDVLDAVMTSWIICGILGTAMGIAFMLLMNRLPIRKKVKGGMNDEKWKDQMKKNTKQKQTPRRKKASS